MVPSIPGKPTLFMKRGRTTLVVLALVLVGACGTDAGAGPPINQSVPIALDLTNLARLDPLVEGSYEVWVVGSDGKDQSAGRFQASGSGFDRIMLQSPIANPTRVRITLEPPGEDDNLRAPQSIISGAVAAGRANLDYISSLTAGLPFVEEPGSHKLFTPSDNAAASYPSNEDAGLWLFQAAAGNSGSAAFWLDFMPLRPEWTYEGWIVLDYGSSAAVWFSYGKFAIDVDKQAKFEDDTGFGPFSGRLNYTLDPLDEIAMPGDDWVANALGVPLPGGLPDEVLPLDLNGCAESTCRAFWQGPSRFTHVITVEPITDVGEDPWLARPFYVAPYRNPIGQGDPNVDRVIQYFPAELPSGVATIGL